MKHVWLTAGLQYRGFVVWIESMQPLRKWAHDFGRAWLLSPNPFEGKPYMEVGALGFVDEVKERALAHGVPVLGLIENARVDEPGFDVEALSPLPEPKVWALRGVLERWVHFDLVAEAPIHREEVELPPRREMLLRLVASECAT